MANDNVTINTSHTLTIPSGQIASAGVLNDKGILKNFGTLSMGKFTTTGLQNIDYFYHIRGGLRGINLDNAGNLTNRLFSMKLAYEDDGTYFDGNIRNQYWKSNIDGIQRAYQYSYDGASRITGATYAGKAGESYALENIAYDFNGNITNLWRKGMTQNNTFDYIDKLSYTYGTNSNKINSVTDAVAGNLDTGDFRDGNKIGNDYDYWADGSLKKDLNKGIDSIKYNYLKLPQRIKFSNGNTLVNQYDATGKKLKSISSDGVTYDFINNVILKNNVLYQIGIDEGRIVNGQYEFDIKDHLGNLRVSFRDSLGIAKISTKLDYDPWGLTLKSLTYTNPTLNKNNFQFGSKEKIESFGINWIDFGARIYMPDVPHFLQIDPMSEISRRFSPYVYGLNNPLRYIDPDGNQAYDVTLTGKEAQAAFTELQASVQKDLTLAMDANGKVTYTQNGTGKISKDSKQLVDAIDDHSIVVNVNAENTSTTKSGSLYIGGAFSGNTVTQGANGNTVVAEQEINPKVLSTADNYYGKPGGNTLHEVTEAYQGAKISQASGISSGNANATTNIYQSAHNSATPQTGAIFERAFDARGNILPAGVYTGAVRAEYYVQKGFKAPVIILKIP